jgi:hypothetical protein
MFESYRVVVDADNGTRLRLDFDTQSFASLTESLLYGRPWPSRIPALRRFVYHL